MDAGKTASQAGHAYLGAYLKSDSKTQSEYHSDGIGTKVCLVVPNIEALRRVYDQAKELEHPCVFIEDSGCPNFFNGAPTATAVGVGPLTRNEAKFLKKLPLLK